MRNVREIGLYRFSLLRLSVAVLSISDAEYFSNPAHAPMRYNMGSFCAPLSESHFSPIRAVSPLKTSMQRQCIQDPQDRFRAIATKRARKATYHDIRCASG